MKKNNSLRDFLITSSPENQILNWWNDTFLDVKGITKHYSLKVKCQQKNEITGEIYYTTLEQIIQNILLTYKIDYIKESISNYHTILTNNEYFYKISWKLGDFLSDGIFIKFFSSKDPFNKFRRSSLYKGGEDDPIWQLAKGFEPLTVSYDKSQIYDRDCKTYFGFSINKLKKFKSYASDVEYIIKHSGKIDMGFLYMIELSIAGLLFIRKKEPRAKEVMRFMELWKKYKKVVI